MEDMPFTSWLTLLFIYLRLTDQIDWPWLVVVAPLILSVAVRALFYRTEKSITTTTKRP